MYRGNLANLYMGRGEVERARSLLREIVAGYDPAAAEIAFARAAALSSLATAERRLGELGPAEEHVRQALAIHEGRAPESLGALHARNVLGSVLQAQKRWPEATAMHLRALETAERTAPASATASETLAHLGAVALASGSLDEAERRYAAALELQRAIAPGTRQEAEWLHARGNVSAARGRGDEAIDRWLEAIAVLDGLRGRLGGPVEAGAGFTSLYHELYWAPLDALAARGRAEEAYLLSERFRAQAFLASLAGRDLDLAVDLSPELDRERRRLAALYDATLRRVRTASGPLDSPARAQLRTELDQVRAQREENEGRVVAASPRQAALRLPHPADAVATLAALPARTLMLAYVLGPERSWLFVLGPQKRPVAAIQLPTGLPEFHRAVTEFRRLADHPGTREAGRLELAGATLSRLLLAPAAERLRDADHLLVVPDGPLHLLPWAALPEPGRRSQAPQAPNRWSRGARCRSRSRRRRCASCAPLHRREAGSSSPSAIRCPRRQDPSSRRSPDRATRWRKSASFSASDLRCSSARKPPRPACSPRRPMPHDSISPATRWSIQPCLSNPVSCFRRRRAMASSRCGRSTNGCGCRPIW